MSPGPLWLLSYPMAFRSHYLSTPFSSTPGPVLRLEDCDKLSAFRVRSRFRLFIRKAQQCRVTFHSKYSECNTTCQVRGHHSFPPGASLPCESKLVQGSVAFFFCLSHIQAKATTAFEGCWEFIDRTGEIVLLRGCVLLLLDGFGLEEEKEERIPLPCKNIFGKIYSTRSIPLKEKWKRQILRVTEIRGIDFLVTIQSLSITGQGNSLKYCSFFTFFSVLHTIVS